MKIKVLTETTEGNLWGSVDKRVATLQRSLHLRCCLLMQRSGCCEWVQIPTQCLTHLKNLIAKLKVGEEMSRHAA